MEHYVHPILQALVKYVLFPVRVLYAVTVWLPLHLIRTALQHWWINKARDFSSIHQVIYDPSLLENIFSRLENVEDLRACSQVCQAICYFFSFLMAAKAWRSQIFASEERLFQLSQYSPSRVAEPLTFYKADKLLFLWATYLYLLYLSWEPMCGGPNSLTLWLYAIASLGFLVFAFGSRLQPAIVEATYTVLVIFGCCCTVCVVKWWQGVESLWRAALYILFMLFITKEEQRKWRLIRKEVVHYNVKELLMVALGAAAISAFVLITLPKFLVNNVLSASISGIACAIITRSELISSVKQHQLQTRAVGFIMLLLANEMGYPTIDPLSLVFIWFFAGGMYLWTFFLSGPSHVQQKTCVDPIV